MGLQTIAPDVLMTCPLDEAHRILKSRMQFHLVRCLKNHTLEKKMRCPWNPLHIVNRLEYLDHCNSKCEDLTNVMGSKILSEDDAHRDVASIPVSAMNAVLPDSEEDWDAQPSVGTYDPLKRTEDKPILRSSIGLSRARRKQFHLQERMRHQKLEDYGPIQIPPPKELNSTKLCRAPHKPPIATSTDVSLMNESSSSKIFDDDDKFAKLPTNLREPHKPSPALIYEEIKDSSLSNGASKENNVTLFDAQFDESNYQSDGASYVSNASSRHANIAALQALLSKEKRKSSASAPSAKMPESAKTEPTKAPEILYDEATNSPAVHPTTSGDDADELARELANLELMQKQIDEKRSKILRELSQYDKKCVNSASNSDTSASNERESIESDKVTKTLNVSPNAKLQNGFNNRKCAANFGNTTITKKLPMKSLGRGIVVDFSDFEIPRPGNQGSGKNSPKPQEQCEVDAKENANPFSSANGSVESIKSSKKKIDKKEMGSFYGYELDD